MVDLSKAVVGSKWKIRDGRIATYLGRVKPGDFHCDDYINTHPYLFNVHDYGRISTDSNGIQFGDLREETFLDIVEPEIAATNVLQEALAVAGNGAERARDYGHPLDNHERIANFWNVYLKGRKNPDAPISPIDAGYMMVLLKVAREQNSPKRDNKVDLAGYTLCIEQMENEIKRRAEEVSDL